MANISIFSLQEALKRLETNYDLASTMQGTSDLRLALKTAAIQSFGCAYGVAITLIERYLQETGVAAEAIKILSFKVLVQTAAEKGLLSNPTAWLTFRDKRNITPLTYTEGKAMEVFTALPAFIEAAKELRIKLEEAINASLAPLPYYLEKDALIKKELSDECF